MGNRDFTGEAEGREGTESQLNVHAGKELGFNRQLLKVLARGQWFA
jgi:hypothetical protein